MGVLSEEAGGEGDGGPDTGGRIADRVIAAKKDSTPQGDAMTRATSRGLHVTEELIYALTALVLSVGALVVLVEAVHGLATEVDEGVAHAIEATLDSLLIVFILVELLSAVRTAFDEHTLVAEPFLLVGILASIKEIVVLATFGIETERASESALKIGVLGAIVVGLAVATLILRRREREPKEASE